LKILAFQCEKISIAEFGLKVYAYGLSPKEWKIIDLKGDIVRKNNSIENSDEIMINYSDLSEVVYLFYFILLK